MSSAWSGRTQRARNIVGVLARATLRRLLQRFHAARDFRFSFPLRYLILACCCAKANAQTQLSAGDATEIDKVPRTRLRKRRS